MNPLGLIGKINDEVERTLVEYECPIALRTQNSVGGAAEQRCRAHPKHGRGK